MLDVCASIYEYDIIIIAGDNTQWNFEERA